MLLGPYKDVEEAEKAAIEESRDGSYVILVSNFGIFLEKRKRFHVFTPSDTPMPYYFNSGKRKKFTDSQWKANYNATPILT